MRMRNVFAGLGMALLAAAMMLGGVKPAAAQSDALVWASQYGSVSQGSTQDDVYCTVGIGNYPTAHAAALAASHSCDWGIVFHRIVTKIEKSTNNGTTWTQDGTAESYILGHLNKEDTVWNTSGTVPTLDPQTFNVDYICYNPTDNYVTWAYLWNPYSGYAGLDYKITYHYRIKFVYSDKYGYDQDGGDYETANLTAYRGEHHN